MSRTVVFDMHLTLFRKIEVANSIQQLANVEAMPQAMETFLSFYDQGYKIVILSTSIIQDSRVRLEALLKKHGLDQEKIKQIFKDIDILTMRYYGTKHSVSSWRRALEPYKNIDYIFEDGENKLQAAGEAARQLESDPELFSSVIDFIG
jgi:hypothetical protein